MSRKAGTSVPAFLFSADRLPTRTSGITSGSMPKAITLALKVGDRAPDFEALTTDGTQVRLRDAKGKPVVLFFYPKDDTPGCTKEACGFRDLHADFRKKGALVWGVSVDPVIAHQPVQPCGFQHLHPMRVMQGPDMIRGLGRGDPLQDAWGHFQPRDVKPQL